MSEVSRAVLPIPDRPDLGLTTYDAKDPDTSFPPIEPLLPPEGAPNVLVILLDDIGFGASSAFGGPCHTPTAERLAGRGLKYTRFHTTALCAPTRQALLTGQEPPLGLHGKHHRDGHVGTGTEFASTQHQGPVGHDVEAQRLLDEPVRKVPRGAGLAVLPHGTIRHVALGWGWVRVLLRLHRRGEQPVVSGPL